MKPEFIPQSNGILNVSESTDLKDAFQELNLDEVDTDGFSGIDLRTRLTASQIPALVGLDVLCISGVYPKTFSRIGKSVKRLAVSLKGAGRQEMVDISKGARPQEVPQGKSVLERASQ